METFSFPPQAQAQKNNPLFHDFLAGDSTESSISDCESSVTSSCSTHRLRRRRCIFPEEMAVELNEGDRVYEVIRQRFLSCMGDRTTVAAIHRRNWSEFSAQAKLQSFQIHSRALASKHGGSPNVKFAWYGNGRERIEQIISHGFSHLEVQSNISGALLLSPDDSPASSLEGSVADEDGLRHVLLCRVILGRQELVPPESDQTHPSWDEFDSGVDDLHKPKKYIIWSTNMNSYILPEYVVSFRLSAPAPPPFKDCSRMENGMNNMKMPTSPWISFPSLISALAKFLPQNAISVINKYHKDYKERRLTRTELIKKVRQITGDELLVAVIKSWRSPKEVKKSIRFLPNVNTNQE